MTADFETDAWSAELLQAALVASAYEAEREETPVPPAEALATLGERVTASTAEVTRRDFVLWPHLARGIVSATFAPGGLGKSTLALAEAVAIASGFGLFGPAPDECCRVLYLSSEDGPNFLQPRLTAVLSRYGLTEADIRDRLHVHVVRDRPLAEGRGDGVEFDEVRLEGITGLVRSLNIGLVIIDTLKTCCPLNLERGDIVRRVVARFARLAVEGNCAVELVHHTRKLNGREITIDDMGGAADLAAAVRSARGLQPMADSDAALWGVSSDEQDQYVRVKVLKSNMAPKLGFWFRLAPVRLAAGTEVYTAEPWTPPNPYAEVSTTDAQRVQHVIARGREPGGEPWRANIQAGDAWAGHAVAEALKLSVKNAAELNRIRFLLKTWIESGALVIVQRPIGARSKQVPVVEVGARA